MREKGIKKRCTVCKWDSWKDRHYHYYSTMYNTMLYSTIYDDYYSDLLADYTSESMMVQ